MRANSIYFTVEELDFYAKRAKEYKMKDFSVSMIEQKKPEPLLMLKTDTFGGRKRQRRKK